MSNYQEVELSDADDKKWRDTRAALVWHAPAFTHIFYTMMNKKGSKHMAMFAEDVPFPTAATDGQHLLFKPSSFFQLNLQKRVFVVCHEICHGMFAHCELMQKLYMAGKIVYPDGKELPYDQETLNKAADYVINDMLIESKIGTYDERWLHDKVKGTHMDDVLTVYRRIYEPNGGGGGGNQPDAKGQSGFDEHMKPGATTGQDPNAAAQGRNEMEWKTAIAGGLAAARAQGKLPEALKRFMEEMLEPEVDWTDKVQGWMSRKTGGGGYDWKRADRRFMVRNIVIPARSGYGCGIIVVAGDSSGSIQQKQFDRFFGEMHGILRDLNPQQIIVMWCDAAVKAVDYVEDVDDLIGLAKKGGIGGGGTDFRPVFKKIRKLGIEPDALIYLTDGDGTFPDKAPQYPVLWGDISKEEKKYPWGDVIYVPV